MTTSFEDFSKIELKVGRVTKAEKVSGSDKLLVLNLDLGSETREIVSGIAKSYNSEDLVGKDVVVVANLEPKTIKGIESCGMLLAAKGEGGLPVILVPEKKTPPGSIIS